MYLICSDNGLYKYEKGNLDRLCCEGEIVYDFIPPNIVCTDSGVYVNDKKVIEGGCWRLFNYNNNKIFASIEGPKVYDINGNLIIDLTEDGRRLGWEFPHGPPHITDFILYRGYVVATVEEGNLLVGEDLKSLRPVSFFADMHNLLVKHDELLIASAYALYKTDLKEFRAVAKGYFHGLVDLGEIVVAQVMSNKPLMVSSNLVHWENLGIELPRPTFGVTGIDKIDENRIVYSTTSLYEINLIEKKPLKLADLHSMTRRVIVLNPH